MKVIVCEVIGSAVRSRCSVLCESWSRDGHSGGWWGCLRRVRPSPFPKGRDSGGELRKIQIGFAGTQAGTGILFRSKVRHFAIRVVSVFLV